jgi:MFS family permease
VEGLETHEDVESIYKRPDVRKSSTLSIVDITIANLVINLTGGAFLQGYAINILGAEGVFIGLIIALPGFMALFQLITPMIVASMGSRKKASVSFGLAGRIVLIFVPLLAYYPFTLLGEIRLWILIFLLTLSSFFLTICNGVTFSWLGDLVSPKERGNYFGRRSMPGGFIILIFSFISARFLDKFGGPSSFTWIFGFAVFAGIIGIIVKSKMVEPRPLPAFSKKQARSALRKSFLDRNFRPLLVFTATWNFAVMLGSSFFNPYVIGDLRLSYTLVTMASIMSNIAVTGFSGFWGKNIDRFGGRPVILFASFFKIFMPALWIFITPYNASWLLVTQLLNLFNQGITIGTNKLLLELSPHEERDAYVSMYNAVTGLVTALAPAIGGLFLPLLRGSSFELLGATVEGYKFLFIASFFLRAFAIIPIIFVKESGATSVEEMIKTWKGNSTPQNTTD